MSGYSIIRFSIISTLSVSIRKCSNEGSGERERRYAKLGWLITDIMLRAWNWAYSLVPKRFRGQ